MKWIPPRPWRRALWASAGLLSTFLVCGIGCNSTAPYLRDYAAIQPSRYVILLPEGRQALAPVKDFMALKASQGFAMEVLTFLPTGSRAERIAAVQDLLARRRPPPGEHAYLLIMASHAELPMGPWRIAGMEKQWVCSDLPYLLGKALTRDIPIRDEDWTGATSKDFPWICGRFPYVEEALLGALAQSTRAFADRQDGDLALLGAERFAIWADSSLILTRAKEAFKKAGWEAKLFATDWPNDVTLMPGMPGPDEAPVFMEAWASESPRAVYLLSHSGDNVDLDNNPEGECQGAVVSCGIGRRLIPAFALKRLAEGGWDRRPARPAVLLTTGCFSAALTGMRHIGVNGRGVKTVVRDVPRTLFEKGWICAFAGSTQLSSPLPLFPAIHAEINTGTFVGRGLPLGLAVQAVRNVYDDQCPWALTYWLLPSARRMRKVNLFSYTLYGDPSLRVAGSAPR